MENELLGLSLGKTIVFVIMTFSSLPNGGQHSTAFSWKPVSSYKTSNT